MRQITVKYSGDCRKCGESLEVGQPAIYERRVGLFCLQCEPTDSEEIREYRAEAAERKASKYDEWAEKREAKADSVFNLPESDYRRDWAFITQPGHIPARARLIKQQDCALEGLGKAREMRGKAAGLRSSVRVKGDAEKKHQRYRDFITERVSVGCRIESIFFGLGTVEKIFKNSLRVKYDRGFTNTSDKGHFSLPISKAQSD